MRRLALATLLAALAVTPAAAEIKRVGPETSPIASAVVVPAGYDIIYVSGITPPVTNPGAPEGTPREFGDTKTQTIGVIERIKGILESQGATLGDVVMMRVLLVGDPALDGKMDFAGMMEGYRQYFANADQPNRPARITSQVSALVAPGMMVEIEVQAAVKPK
ncbi:RidA family protein [Phenylobacterium sp.]|uniref:RidA family protein n=1 Tax=Phenylobacterium sp. TaxID=1871053 RepID=UPI00272F7E9F|nr:RidA family protein [Phenylobacterium sp.]MDP1874266.1 RidA family protein [Phenylobacterium sp.]MDP3490370.1 RidA family protein [Phenylobacterium sp.]